jgi:hypothetical protein
LVRPRLFWAMSEGTFVLIRAMSILRDFGWNPPFHDPPCPRPRS